jgi:hypothetical protein
MTHCEMNASEVALKRFEEESAFGNSLWITRYCVGGESEIERGIKR